MARYIDADALSIYFDALIKHAETEGLYNMAHVYERCLRIVKDAPTADVAPRAEWISVDERLPEVAGRAYLVWDDVQKAVKKRFFYRIPTSIPLETYPYIREYFGNSADYKRYTHWMPLPDPPKGD